MPPPNRVAASLSLVPPCPLHMGANLQTNTYTVTQGIKYLEITLIQSAGPLFFKTTYFSETIFRKQQAFLLVAILCTI